MKSEQETKHTVEIEILNQKYRIKTEAEPEWVNEVADFVKEKINEVVTSKAPVNKEKAAVLAALNIAGELLQLKKSTEQYKDHVSRQSQELIKLIDAQI